MFVLLLFEFEEQLLENVQRVIVLLLFEVELSQLVFNTHSQEGSALLLAPLNNVMAKTHNADNLFGFSLGGQVEESPHNLGHFGLWEVNEQGKDLLLERDEFFQEVFALVNLGKFVHSGLFGLDVLVGDLVRHFEGELDDFFVGFDCLGSLVVLLQGNPFLNFFG